MRLIFKIVVFAVLVLLGATVPSEAAFVITLSQVGGNVVVNGSGTLNLGALTLQPGFPSIEGNLVPGLAILEVGPPTLTHVTVWTGTIVGPSSFGANVQTNPNSGSGSIVGIDMTRPEIVAPQNFVLGQFMTDSMTYTGKNFASLGFTPGIYTYTWGTGANADSLTIEAAVPELSTWCAGTLIALGLFSHFVRRTRTRSA